MSNQNKFHFATLLAAWTFVLAAAVSVPGFAEEAPASGTTIAKNDALAQKVDSLAGVPFTNESLKQALEDMGYEVRSVRINADSTHHWIRFENERFTGEVCVEISPSGRTLWVWTTLVNLESSMTPTVEQLQLILERNDEMELNYFRMRSYDKGIRELQIATNLPNCVTRSLLRKRIAGLIQHMTENAVVWKIKPTTAATAATAAK